MQTWCLVAVAALFACASPGRALSEQSRARREIAETHTAMHPQNHGARYPRAEHVEKELRTRRTSDKVFDTQTATDMGIVGPGPGANSDHVRALSLVHTRKHTPVCAAINQGHGRGSCTHVTAPRAPLRRRAAYGVEYCEHCRCGGWCRAPNIEARQAPAPLRVLAVNSGGRTLYIPLC